MANLSSAPAQSAVNITPGTPYDGTIRALWVGQGGDVTGKMQDGTTITLSNVGTGTMLPVAFDTIESSTTASLLVGLY